MFPRTPFHQKLGSLPKTLSITKMASESKIDAITTKIVLF
jgi:hypothetical protein